MNFEVDTDNPIELRQHIEQMKKRLFELEHLCQHKCGPSNPADPSCSHPVCTKCGSHFGGEWYCPKSPNGICVYDAATGYQYCVYCSEPSTRT